MLRTWLVVFEENGRALVRLTDAELAEFLQ
jgi:hypothetical protein